MIDKTTLFDKKSVRKKVMIPIIPFKNNDMPTLYNLLFFCITPYMTSVNDSTIRYITNNNIIIFL